MLTKFICSSKIYFNQSIIYLSTKEKKEELSEQKNQRHLLSIIKQLIMFMKTWKSIIQPNKEKN